MSSPLFTHGDLEIHFGATPPVDEDGTRRDALIILVRHDSGCTIEALGFDGVERLREICDRWLASSPSSSRELEQLHDAVNTRRKKIAREENDE